MSITVSAPELAALRERVLLPKRYLSVCPRTTVFSGQINGSPLTDNETSGYYGAAYDNETGDWEDVREGMSIDFGTTPGARDLGTRRIRYNEATAAFIYFTESSPGALAITDNTYFTVVDEYRPHVVIPRGKGTKNGTPYTNDITLYIDYDKEYVNQNLDMPPKANITRDGTTKIAPKASRFVDDWQTDDQKDYATVTLSSNFSKLWGYLAVTFDHLWDVVDGTVTVGALDEPNITVRFPVGFRHIRLTMTDNNGAVGTMVFPIWVHDESYMPLTRFQVERDSTGEWREVDLNFFEQDTDEEVIPAGTTLCYWKLDDYETPVSLLRDQMIGWSLQDTTIPKKYAERNLLTIMGIGGWLDKYRAFPLRVDDPGDPFETWFEMNNITCDKLAYYVLLNMTSATMIANLFDSDVADGVKALDVTGNSPWAQVKYIVSGYYGRAASASLNDIWLRRHRSYGTQAERSAVSALFAMSDGDWLWDNPPQITRNRMKSVGQVLGGGAAYNAFPPTLYASRAPGRSPNEGSDSPEAPFQNLPVVNPQDTLNWLTGQHLAYLNNERASVNVQIIPQLDIIEPAWMLPITLTTLNSRSGLTLNDDEFLVKEVTLGSGDRGRDEVAFAMEGVTLGLPGQFEEVPLDPNPPIDALPPIEIPYIPWENDNISRLPNWNGTNRMPVKIVALDANGANFARASSWDASSGIIDWEDISTGLTGYGIWMSADPYDYRRYFVLMSTGLFRCDNVWGSSPTWTQVATPTQLFDNASGIGSSIVMSINRRGYIAVPTGNFCVCISFDYGVSWTRVNFAADTEVDYAAGTALDQLQGGFAVSSNNGAGVNRVYATGGSPFGGNTTAFRSDNWGLAGSWSAVANNAALGFDGNITSTPKINIPHTRSDGSTPNSNDADQEIYLSAGAGTRSQLIFSDAAGVTWTTKHYINAAGNNARPTGSIVGYPLMTFTHDGSIVFWAGGTGVAYSIDGGVTETENISNMALATQWTHHINGFSTHSGAILAWNRAGTAAYLTWSFDGAVTFVSGNIPTFFTLTGGLRFCANVQFDLSDFVAPAAA